jgi:hypothetical protein
MTVLNERFVGVLDQIRAKLEGAGEESSEEKTDGSAAMESVDAFNSYLLDLADKLAEKFDVSHDDAIDFIIDAADELADAGDLPWLPDDEDSGEDMTEWLSKAKKIGFSGYVMKAAREMV